MDQETVRELKRIRAEISLLHKEDRLLRERISTTTGDVSSTFYAQSSLNGILSVGDGISGGGTFPGSVSIAVDLSATSGLEFSSGELQIADSIAGNGLSISSKVLAVSVGNGLEISGDSVLVGLSATSGLEFSSGDLQIADSIAGSGLAISSKILAVGAGDGIAVAADAIAVDLVAAWSGLEFSSADLRVDLDAAFTWTALHTFSNSPSITFAPGSDTDHNLWTINVTGTPTVSWDESEDSVSQTHDLILQKRCFGFLKSQDENGRIGNGPVEYGEVVAVGGIMEVAPSAALYEAVTIN